MVEGQVKGARYSYKYTCAECMMGDGSLRSHEGNPDVSARWYLLLTGKTLYSSIFMLPL